MTGSIQCIPEPASVTRMLTNTTATVAALIAAAMMLSSCSALGKDDLSDPPAAKESPGQHGDTTPSPSPTADTATGHSEGADDGSDTPFHDGLEDLEDFEAFQGFEGFDDVEMPDFNTAVPLPDGFPTDVPLVDGIVFQAEHTEYEFVSMYSLAINSSDSMAKVEEDAATALLAAGFTAVDDSWMDFGEGFAVQSYERTEDTSFVVVTIMDVSELGFTLVGYTVDFSTYDFG